MDYWLLDDNQNEIVAHSNSNYYDISKEPEKMIHHEPFLVCSHTNTDENNLRNVERLFPDQNQEIILDERPVNVGLSKMDLRNNKLENSVSKKTAVEDATDTFEPVAFKDNIPEIPFTPGKAEFAGYAASIDLESRLKRIDYNDNLCYVKNFNPNSDLKTHYDILKKDYRIPVRTIGENKCTNFELPMREGDKYVFELGNKGEKFFHYNTRRKTQNDW